MKYTSRNKRKKKSLINAVYLCKSLRDYTYSVLPHKVDKIFEKKNCEYSWMIKVVEKTVFDMNSVYSMVLEADTKSDYSNTLELLEMSETNMTVFEGDIEVLVHYKIITAKQGFSIGNRILEIRKAIKKWKSFIKKKLNKTEDI